MSNWKFTDATNKVVHRFNEDGSQESCLVEVLADWLSEGNTPEPADVPPPPTKAERIRALEAQASDAQAKVTRQALLALALEKACADPAAAGLTPSEVHDILMTGDNGYQALYLLEQQVEAIRIEAS